MGTVDGIITFFRRIFRPKVINIVPSRSDFWCCHGVTLRYENGAEQTIGILNHREIYQLYLKYGLEVPEHFTRMLHH